MITILNTMLQIEYILIGIIVGFAPITFFFFVRSKYFNKAIETIEKTKKNIKRY